MSSSRLVHLVAVVLLAGVLAIALPGVSSAVFTSSSTSTATVRAALDWTPPTVALTDPGAHVRGTLPVVATASDRESGIARVTLELLPPGGSWTSLCAPTAAPYSCAWNTASRADGQYALRATARDNSGFQTVSAVARPVVDNTAPTVTMTDPGTSLTGLRTFSAQATDATSGIARVVFQHAPTGTADFRDLCAATAPTTGATWRCDTPAALSEGRYDLRAVAIDRAGNLRNSATLTNRTVDDGPNLAGADIQTANGGGTLHQIDRGDVVTFTFNRRVDLATIATGWDGSARTVPVRFGLGFITNDTMEPVGVNLGRVNLGMNYVQLLPFTVNATMTASTDTSTGRPRTVVTLVLDEEPPSSRVRVVDQNSKLVWSPSTLVSDLLGNRSSASDVAELGASDKEF